jgi:CIC family chloride channel protein
VFRPESLEVRRDEIRVLVRRSREVVLLAALTGIAVGLAVRGFEYLVDEAFYRLLEQPVWVTAVAPAVGLICAAIALRVIGGGTSPATSDEYLRAFHDPQYRLGLRQLAARTVAAIATLGSGGSLGMEGPP